MARRRGAAGADRGGESVQAPRPAGARVALWAGAVGCEAAVGAYAAARAGTAAGAVEAAAAALVVVFAAAVALRRPRVVPWTLFGLAAIYVATLHGDAVDGWSIGVATALFAASELASAAIGHERRIREEREVTVRRAAVVVAVAAAGVLAGLVVFLAAGTSPSAGLPLLAVGTAAAVGLLLGLARLASASSRSSSSPSS